MSSISGSVGYISYTMFIEPTITWVPWGFSGYIWLDTKIVFLKKNMAVPIWSVTVWSVTNQKQSIAVVFMFIIYNTKILQLKKSVFVRYKIML